MEKFDAIVVGAGPAGSTSAYVMARAGLKVVVFERGKYPGAKNTWGGALFGPQLHHLFPRFWDEAPVERFVARHVLCYLGKRGLISLHLKSMDFESPPYNGFVLLRARFDSWLAKKAQAAGAILVTGMRIDDLMIKDERIVGVKAGKEQFFADVVVLAEGVNSLLTGKAGLRKELSPRDLKQGVKEVIRLPSETIEERFNLRGREGVAMEFIGAPTKGLPGGGFLYTNRDSLSLGLVVELDYLVKRRVRASDLLEEFKNHPEVAKLIEGGQTVEYSAHLIPGGGLKGIPRLYRAGLLVTGDAASLVLGTGLVLQGANFAIASGVAAAEAVKVAKQKGDFSEQTLAYYESLLNTSFVLRDLQTFKRAPEFLKNERIYETYPELIFEWLEKIFRDDGQPRDRALAILRKIAKDKLQFWRAVSDFLKMWRAI